MPQESVRVVRQAATLNREIEAIRRNATNLLGLRSGLDQLVARLQGIDPYAAQSVKSLDHYMSRVRNAQMSHADRRAPFGTERIATQADLAQIQRLSAGITQAIVPRLKDNPATRDVAVSLENYLSTVRSGPFPAVGGGGPGGISPQASQAEQVAIPPGALGGARVAPAQARETPREVASEQERTADTVERSLRRQSRAYRDLTYEQHLGTVTDRGLRKEWKESRRDLREQYRDLDKYRERYERLRKAKDSGRRLAPLEDQKAEVLAHLQDLRHGLPAFTERDRAVRAEIARRGMTVDAGVLLGGRGGGGAGGGGVIPTFLRAAGLGRFTTRLGLAATAGYGAYRAWQFVRSGATEYEKTQRRVFELGMRFGGGFGGIRRAMYAGMPYLVRPEETAGAMSILAQQTGRTDVGGMGVFARAYGLPVEQTVGLMARMGMLGILPPGSTSYGWEPMAAQQSAQRAVPSLGTVFGQSLRLGAELTGAARPTLMGAMERSDRIRAGIMPRYHLVMHEHAKIQNLLAGAYRQSAYYGRGNDAFMQAFLESNLGVMQIQAAGGMPIRNYELVPGMMAAATGAYGARVHPRFAAEAAGGFLRALTQAPNDAARGIQLRAVLGLGRRMSPAQLRSFAAATGGIDLTSYTGAIEALQTAGTLPPEQARLILGASLKGIRRFTGRDTELERMFFMPATGGNAGPARKIAELSDQFLTAQVTGVPTEGLVKQIQERLRAAGGEAAPVVQGIESLQAQLTTGEPVKKLGQSLKQGVLDFLSEIMSAQHAWDTSGIAGAPVPLP